MDERKLVLLHTNDIHSHFEQMPRIGEALRQLRAKHADCTPIVIDGGDHIDRMRPETEGSDGLANIAVMNETGYDLVVPGNNEGLTLNSKQLAAAYAEKGKFSVICANFLEESTGERPTWMAPYHIMERDGLRIGFIGLTAYFPIFYSLLGWNVLEPLETAAELAERVRPHVHVLVIVSHLGLSLDKKMAEQIDGIDVIIGGHTHHLLEKPLLLERTYIAATGCYGQYVGELEFRYDMERRELRFVQGGSLRTDSFEPSYSLSALIEDERQASRRALARHVATLARPLAISWSEESELGNLLASGIRRWVDDAEIGIVNAGQILQGLEAGAVTQHRLLEICPSPINTCLLMLSGEQIRLALEQSLLEEYIGKPLKGFGFRGKELGTLCVSGLRIEYDPKAEPYDKIRSIEVNGEPIDPERRYRVGSIDMFTFGIGYLSLGQGHTLAYYLPEFIRDILQRQLTDADELRNCAIPRWIGVGTE